MDTWAVTAGLPSPTPVLLARQLLAPHSPERTCVACRRKRPQGELLRLTKVNGVWTVQYKQRTGRGSYLCFDTPACWAEKRLKRSFGAQAGAISTQLLESSTALPIPIPQPPVIPKSTVIPQPPIME
jgi:uncharacterized protein